jgi:23S rRNA (cytosine1962-C5)-methyltransferase
MIQINSPANWKDYALLDCGDFEKLERFGNYVLIRPEPQAMWSRLWSTDDWNSLAHARFIRDIKGSNRFGENENGGWKFFKSMPQQWQICYESTELKLNFKLSLTSFGHIGVFPEQAGNWEFIYNEITRKRDKNPRVLNLFAYTGLASLAAKAAGAEVTHLDSVRQVVNWANENMNLSGLDNIRWVVEDAMKYVQREVKRGKKYNAIILDPPAYGRGPSGEKWILEENLNELVKLTAQILEPENSFYLLNMYSLGFSSMIGLNLASNYFHKSRKEAGELYLHSNTGFDLPLGTYLKIIR